MDKVEILQNALKEQNDFILKMFNDKRILDEVKEEYAKEYNSLYIKIIEIEDKVKIISE